MIVKHDHRHLEGLGVFAARKLSKGLRIVTDQIILAHESREDMSASTGDDFPNISPDIQVLLTHLFAGPLNVFPLMASGLMKDRATVDPSRLQRLFRYNAIEAAGTGCALILLSSLLNYSPVSLAAHGVLRIVGGEQELPYDENTTPYCTWWLGNYGIEVCEAPEWWGITVEDLLRWSGIVENYNRFYLVTAGILAQPSPRIKASGLRTPLAWNPEIKSDCTGLCAEVNVCVGVVRLTPTATTTTTTTTRPTNGNSTPTPIQDGMTTNCNELYKANSGDDCVAISQNNGVSLSELYAWNKVLDAGCGGLLLDYYYCVGIVGGTTTTKKPTMGNGIATPTPTQPGMVDNCEGFRKRNPEVGAGCSVGLNYYVCIEIVGNGVQTPTATQTGMVGNCDMFYFVKKGDTMSSSRTE
ncbi:hypothetical protein DL769_002114 [Monosporascus sp. CRB-8-3]|nr:hypothetical protein DL769_002114 [Monosporascus sp. CRB-8-3]